MRLSLDDARQAARTLLKHKGFTAIAILSLALAIALNTTMYSVMDALVNPPTATAKPEQLYALSYFGDVRNHVSVQARNRILLSGGRTYQALTFRYFGDNGSLIEHGGANMRGNVMLVAPNYFRVMGVHPLAGRLFVDEDVSATERPILVSERVQRRLFPTGQSAVGERVTLGDSAFRVIGVLPRGVTSAGSPEVAWVVPRPERPASLYPFNVLRLRDNATRAQLESELRIFSAQIGLAAGEALKDNGFIAAPMQAPQLHLNNFHYAVIGAVIAVLLVACANLANLQLARGLTRSRELATRAALGASRRDLVNHLMTESAIIGAAGLTLGLLLTFWLMALVSASIPDTIGEYIVEPQVSWRLFVFAAVVALFALLTVGLLPAVRVSRVDPNDLIKSGNGTGSFRRSRQQYGLLLATEIGFALLVACGASLLVRSAKQISTDDLGFDTKPLVSGLVLARVPARSSVKFNDLAAEFSARVRTTRGLTDGALSYVDTGGGEVSATDPSGALRVAPAPMWGYNVVSPSFFRTYGVSMLHGRDFLEGESGAVAIVDPATARALWPASSPVGQMIKFGPPGAPGAWYTVVGVSAPMGTPGLPRDNSIPRPLSTTTTTKAGSHYRVGGQDRSVYIEATTPSQVYVLPTAADSFSVSRWVRLMVRADHNEARAPLVLRNAFAGDTRLRQIMAASLDDWTGVTTQRANHDFVAAMFTFFAVLAVAVAALGVYAIVAHSVAERRREIGVRLALGASDKNVLSAVLGEGNVFLLGGVALGLFLTRYTTTLLRAFLWVPEIDPFAIELFVPAAISMLLIAAAAGFAPALRATRIDPVESLRCE